MSLFTVETFVLENILPWWYCDKVMREIHKCIYVGPMDESIGLFVHRIVTKPKSVIFWRGLKEKW